MNKKKKTTLFQRLFGNRNKVTDFMTEEQLQSPGRLILKNFLHNRLLSIIVYRSNRCSGMQTAQHRSKRNGSSLRPWSRNSWKRRT